MLFRLSIQCFRHSTLLTVFDRIYISEWWWISKYCGTVQGDSTCLRKTNWSRIWPRKDPKSFFVTTAVLFSWTIYNTLRYVNLVHLVKATIMHMRTLSIMHWIRCVFDTSWLYRWDATQSLINGTSCDWLFPTFYHRKRPAARSPGSLQFGTAGPILPWTTGRLKKVHHVGSPQYIFGLCQCLLRLECSFSSIASLETVATRLWTSLM